MTRLSLICVLSLGLLACQGSSTDTGATSGPDCVGAKCDDAEQGDTGGEETSPLPEGTYAEMCEDRRADVFNPNQLAFTSTALRWSCDDVEGVSLPWRGQEYCESFVVVQLPPQADGEPSPDPALLGKTLGKRADEGSTDPGVSLSEYQVAALEAAGSDIVGQCVFTSWNSDVPDPVSCEAGPDCDRPEVMGLPVDTAFRMTFVNNGAEAALDLADECINTATDYPDENNPDDPLHDHFTRGCLHTGDLHTTAWRKSDTIMCSAVVRLDECNCYPLFAEEFADVLGDTSVRGFPLGTWSAQDELPTGCTHVTLPDGSKNVVTCDLTAAQLIGGTTDVKQTCRELYADNVVVHVPISLESVECLPNEGADCPAEPWVLTP